MTCVEYLTESWLLRLEFFAKEQQLQSLKKFKNRAPSNDYGHAFRNRNPDVTFRNAEQLGTNKARIMTEDKATKIINFDKVK